MRPTAPPPAPAAPTRGFTLIELMIAVAIVSILAAVALPSFFDSLRKSRRAEAFNAITAIQQAQERHRSNNAGYADSLTALGIGSATSTPNGYYTLAVVTDTATIATTYIVTAVAVAGTSQASDEACKRLAVRAQGAQVTYAGCASCSFVPSDFSESNTCWAR